MKRSALHLIWFLLSLWAVQIHVAIAGRPNKTTLLVITFMIGLQTLYGFIQQGGRLFNTASAAFYGLLVFVIFPAFYAAFGLASFEHRTSIESLITTVALAGVLQWLLLTMSSPKKDQEIHLPLASENTPNIMGFTVLLLAISVILRPESLSYLQNATGVLAVFFAAYAVVTAAPGSRTLLAFFLLIGSFLYYALFIFSGFGRLNLGVMGVGILMILALRFSGYLLKFGLLGVTAPAVIWLSYQRMDFLEETRGTDISFDEGIGSIVGPFISGSVIVDRMLNDVIDPTLGTTVVAALVVWVPSAMWANKPPGFGAEMVPVTRPELASSQGYSDAALISGEAVWNFGVFGSIIMFLVVVLWIRILDKGLHNTVRLLTRSSVGMSEVLRFVLVIALSSGILNVIWGGWHTYASRFFVIIALSGMLLFFFHLITLSARPRVQRKISYKPVSKNVRQTAPQTKTTT